MALFAITREWLTTTAAEERRRLRSLQQQQRQQQTAMTEMTRAVGSEDDGVSALISVSSVKCRFHLTEFQRRRSVYWLSEWGRERE